MSKNLLITLVSITQFGLIACVSSTRPDTDEGIIVLINGLLIDGRSSQPDSNMAVMIRDGIIQTVCQLTEIEIPENARIMDLKGKTILPGFFNTHVHSGYNSVNLKTWAQAGVTTIRDLGRFNASPAQSYSDRNSLLNDINNARLVAAGPMVTTRGGYGNLSVDSPEDARQTVIGLINMGSDLIKIAIEDDLQGRTWPMLSQGEINTIVKTAHERDIPVSAHISRARHLEMAIEAGVDDVAHMIIDDLPDDLITQMIAKDIYWIPTLELWKGVSQMYSLDWDKTAMKNLRRFVMAGGKVALGTDYDGYVCEFDLGMPIREMMWMQEAGMSPMEIIVSGTRHSAHVCHRENELGTIEKDKIADLVIVRENPLDDIRNLTEIEMVIHNGLVIFEKQ